MEQHSQKNPDGQSSSQDPKTSTEALHASSESCSSAQSMPFVAPTRPKRPLRTPRVEGSTEISQPDVPDCPEFNQEKADSSVPNKASQPSGPIQQLYDDKPCRPPALAGHAAAARSHISMRAASLPQAPSYNPTLTDPSVHPQRALSVAGTADTKPQTDEDFR